MPTGMEISAVGMGLEKLRLELSSKNISAMNHASPVGEAIPPAEMRVNPLSSASFEQLLSEGLFLNPEQSPLVTLVHGNTKLVHEPKNPLANAAGFVEYPDTNHLFEMMNVLKATRAYEANVKAFNAAKAMQEEALNIGK